MPLSFSILRLQSRSLQLLAASLPALLLGHFGCSDTINNHYYYGSSGGAGGSGGSGGRGGSNAQTGGRVSTGGSSGGDSAAGAVNAGASNAGAANGGAAGAVNTGGDSSGAGAPPTNGGEAGAGGTSELPSDYPDAPKANTSVAEHQLDLFGVVGARFWFGVSAEQLEFMNEGLTGGGPIIINQLNGDIYTPGGSGATFADHVWITTAGENPRTADYGKVQLKIVGQSTLRPWNKRSIPNLNIDADEFVDDQRIAGFEHLRLNNAQVGSIFREHLTLEFYRRLGYPAPLSTFAWVSSNVWGKDVSVPYVLVERYKRAFCQREKDKLGGGCANMWEFAGDFVNGGGGVPIPLDIAPPKGFPGQGPDVFDDPENCQIGKCENARVKELQTLLSDTPLGEGFQAATADYVDWKEFQRFQCLSWMLGTGDDALHNQNNVVLVERSDGKFQYLPYSVDISLGQDWYPSVTLAGQNLLARGCQSDKACWAETIATCEGLITDFTQMQPLKILDIVHAELSDAGMLRGGDEARYEYIQAWLTTRLETLSSELEENRESPVLCQDGMIECNGFCAPPEACGACVPPVFKRAAIDVEAAGADGVEPPGDVGGAPGGIDECPLKSEYQLR
ncbi:MAG TPA: CotH kinase family protein [Polyangiaceae bacterium]|nr:CotH kinase family protein [Polyangiaceae bacterium]